MIKKLVKTLLEEIGILGKKSMTHAGNFSELWVGNELALRDIAKEIGKLSPEVKVLGPDLEAVIVRRKTTDRDIVAEVRFETREDRQALRAAIKEQEGLIKGLNDYIRDLKQIRKQALSEGNTEAVTIADAEIHKTTTWVDDFKQKLSEHKLALKNFEYEMGIVRKGSHHSLVFPFAMTGGEKGEVTSADLAWSALDMLDVVAGPADMIVGCLIDPADGVKRSDIFSCLTTKANKLGDEIVKKPAVQNAWSYAEDFVKAGGPGMAY
ncbi:MAG: hypothetical protein K1X66_00030 [Verrucomicrobiae bacterium]|nr:hypothetical protein [Verrucomicrobiae bacterium]